MNIERLISLIIFLSGLGFLLFIIPTHVETVGYGRIEPSTLPKIVAVILILTAAIQLMKEPGHPRSDPLAIIRSIIFISAIIIGIYLMTLFGFEYIAPLLAFAVMLMIGERRWYWLIGGSLIIPLGCWWLVEHVLGRALL